MKSKIISESMSQQLRSSLDQHYLEMLEKTNQQLNSWISSYGVLSAILGVMIGLLGIVAAVIIYYQGADYKKMLEKSKLDLRKELTNKQRQMFEDLKVQQIAALNSFFNLGIKSREDKIVLMPGSIIKGETLNFIYWYGYDQNRYTFISKEAVESWFPESASKPPLTKVSDVTLASIALNGFVGYKPGTRLLKISSDEKIYALSAEMLLHWIETEDLIEKIFGPSWKDILITIPDVFFIKYAIGDSIVRFSDYDPKSEREQASLP